MTTTLTKPRTASIIVDTDGDVFTIQHMLFIGDELGHEMNLPKATRSRVASALVLAAMRRHPHRPTSVFITISAAKRMTDEQIAAIQAAALETRA